MKNSVRFLNLNILSLTQKELLEQMAEGVLYTPNLDHLIKLQQQHDYHYWTEDGKIIRQLH